MRHTYNNSITFGRLMRKYWSEIEFELVGTLMKVGEDMVRIIDNDFSPIDVYSKDGSGNNDFPVWTGNLHDSTGVGVYVEGSLRAYMPTKKARWRTSDGDTKDINGLEELNDALQAGIYDYSEGIWIVLFSAVPYAYRINSEGSQWFRGAGFFDKLRSQLISDILSSLLPKKQPS